MSEYNFAKRSKLVLKGQKPSKRKKHKKDDGSSKRSKPEVDEDIVSHGGWCRSKLVSDIKESVCIEFGNHTYVKALDNGYFTLGPPHDEGDGPSPEEILTAVNIDNSKIALKSGYGKYIGYNKDGCVIGKVDAIGPLEQWEPVFQNDKLGLLASNNCFLSIRDDDDTLIVKSKTAGENEMIKIRYVASVKHHDPLDDIPEEERGNITQIEENYVRKFQKFQDKKLRINAGSKSDLMNAKHGGTLHEALLDRRSKMKSDRYCK